MKLIFVKCFSRYIEFNNTIFQLMIRNIQNLKIHHHVICRNSNIFFLKRIVNVFDIENYNESYKNSTQVMITAIYEIKDKFHTK